MSEPTTFGENELPELAYNFDKWTGQIRGKVLIPEPSEQQVTDFFREWWTLIEKNRTWDGEKPAEDETPEQRDERLERDFVAQQNAALAVTARRRELLSEVCSGTPSVEELEALPHRVQRAFIGYIMRMLDPQA